MASVIAFLWFTQQENVSNFDTPQLTIEQLLTASDVEQGIVRAFKNNDMDALERWQERILAAARQVGYEDPQLVFLDGQRGLDYLQFQAKRRMFLQAVEQAYYLGEAFEPLAGRYPEAADLFPKTQQLFANRNATLEAMTEALLEANRESNEEPLSYAQANAQALVEWQRRLDEAAN
ncbi:hypothetical protein QTP81_10910 [Alteromonas sp. ASW11-36]|uniref:Uncharacterized protein n=1 Tax=Alteromonas arenosi TaxID=3055817 RepID=A0ABT7SZW6_9ALTE|nr:hypothetical protein [Alteromonas sp. ASW11-36]MDM7861107.1 hypothetical protein [Alteromonas sp. ASW11-36]